MRTRSVNRDNNVLPINNKKWNNEIVICKKMNPDIYHTLYEKIQSLGLNVKSESHEAKVSGKNTGVKFCNLQLGNILSFQSNGKHL